MKAEELIKLYCTMSKDEQDVFLQTISSIQTRYFTQCSPSLAESEDNEFSLFSRWKNEDGASSDDYGGIIKHFKD